MRNPFKNNPFLQHAAAAFLCGAALILFLLFTLNFGYWRDLTSRVLGILFPVIAGACTAYILNPVMMFFEKSLPDKLSKKPRRGFALVLTYAVFVGFLVLLGFLIIPQIIESVGKIVSTLPSYLDKTQKYIDDDLAPSVTFLDVTQVYDYIKNSIIGFLPDITNFITGITGWFINFIYLLFQLFLGLFISVYLLWSKESFAKLFRRISSAIFPKKAAEIIFEISAKTHKTFSRFLTGKILAAFAVGALTFVFCLIFRVPYALLIGTIMFVFNIIPMFGPVIGAVPCFIIVLAESPIKALIFLAIVIVLQLADGNFITPKILGDAAQLSPFWVIFSIILGGGLFGVVGMFVAVPAFSVIYSIIRQLIARRERLKKAASAKLEAEKEN